MTASPSPQESNPQDSADAADAVRNRINTAQPHTARIWNYWLGGKDNFAADRAAAEAGIKVNPNAATAPLHGFRDADVAEAIDAVLLVGIADWYPPNYDCGACGYATCAEFLHATKALRDDSTELEVPERDLLSVGNECGSRLGFDETRKESLLLLVATRKSHDDRCQARAQHLIGDPGVTEGELLGGDAIGDAIERASATERFVDGGRDADLVDLPLDVGRRLLRFLTIPRGRTQNAFPEVVQCRLQSFLFLGQLQVECHAGKTSSEDLGQS